MVEKIWLKSWPKGVTKNLEFPEKPITWTIAKHAQNSPTRTAVNYYGRVISYSELDQLVNRFASSLVDLGIRHGDRISLYMENCPQFIIAMLGGCKIGAVIVPSNPMFLGDELVYQLTDAGAETIILQDDLFPVFNSVWKRTPVANVIATNRKEFLPQDPTLPPHHTLLTASIKTPGAIRFIDMLSRDSREINEEPVIDDLALLQYTAETTCTPKGAMITHRNLLFNTAVSANWFDGRLGDIHLSVLPLFEATGLVHSMCMPFYSGGTMILLARYDSETVLKAIELYRCTHWASIATMNIAILNYPGVRNRDLTSLRCCLSGGSPKVVQAFCELTGGASLGGGYGLSQTISQVTLSPMDNPRPGSVGIPVHETEIKIVDIDDWDKELPLGSEGELMVKGPQIMLGYWNRPRETRLALHDGWLATGDVARLDQDGFVYLVGRKKEIIKASGFLIFPQQVENFLCEHPAVAEAAVVGIPDPYRIETVKAYVVLRQEYVGSVSQRDIIEWSRQKMAAYKYPRIIEFVPELPHNGTGKVNRFLLNEWDKRF